MLPLVAILLAANPPCTSGVCVEAQSDNVAAELTLHNRSAAPVAAHFNVELQGARSTSGATFELSLAPGESRRATRIESTGGPWKYTYTFHDVFGPPTAVHDRRYIYALPFERGTAHELVQGENGAISHTGDQAFAYDFGMPEGTPVRAAREGVVVDFKDTETTHGPDPSFLDKANYIYVLHADGTVGQYLHLSPQGVKVTVGERVARGQVIGLSGNTGMSRGPHLHFEVNHAVDALRRQTLPVKFHAAEGSGISLAQGQRYTAAE